MFGLTKREQRWKAEQQAAELLAMIGVAAIKATAEIEVARANADDEVKRLREEVAALRGQLTATQPTGG